MNLPPWRISHKKPWQQVETTNVGYCYLVLFIFSVPYGSSYSPEAHFIDSSLALVIQGFQYWWIIVLIFGASIFVILSSAAHLLPNRCRQGTEVERGLSPLHQKTGFLKGTWHSLIMWPTVQYFWASFYSPVKLGGAIVVLPFILFFVYKRYWVCFLNYHALL